MDILIRKNKSSNWINITKYQNGIINIVETADGTFDKLNLQLLTPSKIGVLDTSRPIPPHYYIKVVEKSITSEIEGVNTFYFRTTDNNTARRRKKIEERYGALYVHEISAVDLTSEMDNTYLPNYRIVQPKTEFYSTYNKSAGSEFILKQRYTQDGTKLILNKGEELKLANVNNDNNIIFGYDEVIKEHYVEFNELDKVGLNIDFNLTFSKSATGMGEFRFIVLQRKRIAVNNNQSISQNNLNLKTYLFNNDLNDGINIENNYVINYNGGNIKSSGIFLLGNFNLTSINELGTMNTNTNNYIVPKNNSYKKVRVYYNLKETKEEVMRQVIDAKLLDVKSNIPNYNDDSYVKVLFDSLNIKATTSAYDYELEEKKITLLEFVDKAVFDYNLNNRNKVFLSEELKVLLDVPAKESEWGDYTLRELLVRALRYVGVKPLLSSKGEIGYKQTTRVPRYIDLEQVNNKQGEHLAENYYDKVVSNAKNLVSQEDFVLEILPIQSTEQEFSQITENNAGFQTSNDIYFISNAVLYAPNLTLQFTNGEEINTNINRPYYWDITERLFEFDIYESFPNVQANANAVGDEASIRARKDLLTQGNTISYTSGSNTIDKLFNIPEFIPNYRLFDGVLGTTSGASPEFAVIEMLIVLAFQQLQDPFGTNLSTEPNVSLADTMGYMLELTYVPIFNELTTKYVSNMPNRKGLNIEKKMNTTNKTISYQENESILRNEMELKGNVKELYSDVYSSISEVIPYNSIVNDNIYITSRVMTISKNVVEVDYILQENFIIQNDDIGLPVNFERYNVPYDYVKRELMLENHLIFSKLLTFKYSNEPSGSTVEFLWNTLFSKGKQNNVNGTLYSLSQLDERLFIMRMAKLETRFTMVLSGMFSDNYNAGNQRYANYDENKYYTTPYRYTDGHGRVNVLNKLVIGYSNIENIKRIQRQGFRNYDLELYPAGNYDGYDVDLNVSLIDKNEPLLIYKDAGEQIAITHTSYLENETEDLKFYSFKQINKIGVLLNDIYLNDNLTIDDVNYSDTTNIFSFDIEQVVLNTYQVNVKGLNVNDYNVGIVFINEERGNNTLVGIIKQPEVYHNDIIFYINNSQYGYYDSIDYVKIIDIEINNQNKYNESVNVDKVFSLNYTDIGNINKYSDIISVELAPSIIIEITNNNEYTVKNLFDKTASKTYVITNNNNYSLISNITTPNITYNINNENDYIISIDSNYVRPIKKPTVSVYYTKVGSNIRWDMTVTNPNTTNLTLEYSSSIGGSYIDAGNINANSSRTITGFRTTSETQSITVYGYARFRNSYGDLSNVGSGSGTYTAPTPTQATWQYNGSSSQPICYSQPEKWIGTPCSNVGQTRVINGSNEGYGDRCIEIICKI